jgi:hypothetical protein
MGVKVRSGIHDRWRAAKKRDWTSPRSRTAAESTLSWLQNGNGDVWLTVAVSEPCNGILSIPAARGEYSLLLPVSTDSASYPRV